MFAKCSIVHASQVNSATLIPFAWMIFAAGFVVLLIIVAINLYKAGRDD